jgi:DNA-binding XRE family transcriptional regulator
MPIREKYITELIAKRLREEREQQHISQTVLANRAGIDRKTVNRIENGHYSPNLETFVLLCRALHIDPSEMLTQ